MIKYILVQLFEMMANIFTVFQVVEVVGVVTQIQIGFQKEVQVQKLELKSIVIAYMHVHFVMKSQMFFLYEPFSYFLLIQCLNNTCW